MKSKIALTMIALLFAVPVYAIPGIQLFIAGGEYDSRTRTWEIHSNSFDLYVVSANVSREDIIVSMALAECDIPSQVDLSFGDQAIETEDWVWGYAPLENAPEDYDGDYVDLHPHGYYPTWFTEIHTGAYDLSQQVGDVRPYNYNGEYWNPATGDGPATAPGQARMFHVELAGEFHYVHFDAYTLNPDGTVDEFAPFSRDAEVNHVPEPGTITLLAMGLAGVGGYVRRRKKI